MFHLADIIDTGTPPENTALGIYYNILYNLDAFHQMSGHHDVNKPKIKNPGEFYAHNWDNLTIYDK